MTKSTTNAPRRHGPATYVAKLQDAESMSSRGFRQIEALANLILRAMETQATLRNPEDIAQGLMAIRDIAQETSDAVFSAVNEVVEPRTDESYESRSNTITAEAAKMLRDVEARVKSELAEVA